MLDKWVKFIVAHEKIALALIAAGILWFALGKAEDMIAKHDEANLRQAQAALQTQASKDAATAQLATQQAQQYQVLAAQVTKQNAALEQENATLTAALTKQQKTDASLPPIALVERLNVLVPLASASVTTNGIALPEAGAVAVTQQLELVPVQQQELVNAQAETKGVNALLLASNGQIVTLNTEISGLHVELKDQQNVCKAQVALVKAEARKSKRRWFVAGFISGVATRILLKF